MVLEKFKRNKLDSNGYIGGRVPKEMELKFKDICTELNISVAEGLRLIIEAEINAFHIDGQAAPRVAARVASQDEKETPPASNMIHAAIEAGQHIPEDFWDDPAAIPPDLDKLSAHLTSYAIKFKDDEKRNKMRIPCPICHKWDHYKKFKENHTNAHGYEKAIDLYSDYQETLETMLNEAVSILDEKKKSREN